MLRVPKRSVNSAFHSNYLSYFTSHGLLLTHTQIKYSFVNHATFKEASIIVRLGIPLIISHLAVIGMATTDTIFAGMVSTEHMAGLSVGAGIWAALSVFILGMCGATATIAAHYHGGGRFNRIGFQVQQTGWIGLASAVLVGLLLATSGFWLKAIQPPGAVTDLAWRYLSILTLACFGFVIAAVLQNACEAVGDTRLAMITNLALLLLNAVFDYCFVTGAMGLPEMGAVGCAWASVCSYWLVGAALAAYLQRQARYRRYHLFAKIWHPHWRTLKKHLAIAVPLAIGSGGEVFFFTSVALWLAPLGATAVAGHQVTLNFSALMYMVPLGFSVALCIRCAQLRGSGKTQAAVMSAFTGVKVTMTCALITGAITCLARFAIVDVYTPDPAVRDMAARLLLLCALYQIFDSIQVASWGALRGFGETRTPMLMQLTAYWLCGFPLGWALAYWQGLGVFGFWWGIVGGLAIAAVLLHTRLHIVTRRMTP